MSSGKKMRTGAELLVDTLGRHGVDRVFCVPGESFLAVLDALHDRSDIETIACRQEGGAAMMAEADGKMTGRPGICFVTRGPGATNASAGVHVAFQDSTPMILFIGQVGGDFMEREAFQEVDYRRMFGPMAKWVAQIDRAERAPEFVARAFSIATAGRPGPVVLALPEDMLSQSASAEDVAPTETPEIFPSEGQMQEIARALRQAAHPLLVLGGSRWSAECVQKLEEFARRFALPVVTTFRRQDRFDNNHPCYLGDMGIGPNPALGARISDADLLVVLGSRLGEMATGGYRLVASPVPKQRIIHIHASAEELGRVFHAALAVNATPSGFVALLPRLAAALEGGPTWSADCEAGHRSYEDWQKPTPLPGPVQMGEIIAGLRSALPKSTIVCNGAGNFAGFVHRHHRFGEYGTQLAPISGSMGYGVPAAVAAGLRHKDRVVLCVAGDGDFLMTGQELATATQYGAKIIVVVVDNGMYGTIRAHQESRYPSRTIATTLQNPDFAALARAYGFHAERVEATAAFAPALERARQAGRGAVIHVVVDPEALSHNRSLTEIRNAGRAALAKPKAAPERTK